MHGRKTTTSFRLLSRWGFATSGAVFLTGILTFACESGGGGFVGEEAPVDDPEKGQICWQCLGDTEPDLVDCKEAEKDVEFLPITIWDFEDTSGGRVLASNMYAYYDGSPATWNIDDGWQPSATEARRCDGEEENHAFNVRGGPFTNWGAGLGRNFKCLNGDQSSGTGEMKLEGGFQGQIPRACEQRDSLEACSNITNGEPADEEEALARSVCPEGDRLFREDNDVSTIPPEDEFLLGMTLDLSEWDGISFWGRRSNDSQPGIRVVIGDKYTDDDLSYLQYHINPDDERYCERNIECGCPGNTRCYAKSEEDGGDGTERCWDSPVRLNNQAEDDTELYLACGNRMCEAQYHQDPGTGEESEYASFGEIDVQSLGTECRSFISRGGKEDFYCYNPDFEGGDISGQIPVENEERCGDHWIKSVRLSTEWEFYKVRFDELLQEGWAQESFHLDVANLSMIRFSWGNGWVDFWLDDVRVYRDKHTTSAK